MEPLASRLFVCYVPGLDRRRITTERTPFVHQLLSTCPTVGLTTHPGTDLLPTMLTGVYPHEHRMWEVSLRPEARMSRRPRLGDRLPGFVSTTLQSVRHLVDRSFDLPAVPARRRRQLDVRRVRYAGRERGVRMLERIGEYRTVFGILAADSRYLFTRRLEALERLGGRLPSGEVALELFEVFALDLFQHWHMDDPRALDRAYRAVDDFIRQLHARCQQRGVTLMVLADHGQEPVSGAIPLMRVLRSSPVPEADYSYFCEIVFARFWFHTADARARLTNLLREVQHTRLLSRRDLRALHIAFEDDTYGELFLAADPGWIFFPNDHDHPLINLYRGLTDGHERPRLSNPRPRGAHGHLPEHPSEAGFALLADERFRALQPQAELIDVAPTLLDLLGEPHPSYMHGRAVFERAGSAREA